MNYAVTVPADFFDEQGLLKEYRPPPVQQIGSMNVLRKLKDPSNAILISEDVIEIQHNISISAPGSIPSPDFPFTEFLSTEVVSQSQIDISSISDMLHPRETNNPLRKASRSTDLPLKSMQNRASDKEMGEIRDLTVSTKHTQIYKRFQYYYYFQKFYF